MKDIAIFAQTTYRNELKKFGIRLDDRRRHMYLIGKTGMGKSTILENMIIDDIRSGNGLAVVDPHGDLAEKVIQFIPDERINDVVYFNPADMSYPIAFNIVEQVDPQMRHLVASGLIGVFQKLWADSWGPRLEYILRNAILAILDFPGSNLLAVVRMLSDKNYRKKIVANIKDPVVKAFWEKEFTGYADKFASEAVAPIQNKVGQFLSNSLMRNIVGQVKSAIDIRDVMDKGKILIMNLSKGRIGEDNSALLGAMMVTKIQLAAMSRVDIHEKDRKDFFLYIDEFQNFSTDSFANILSEARKYRLSLILAHQYIEQLSEKVKPAVFGNVGTMIVFRVGAADAEELVREFTPTFTEEDIVNLPKYEMYLKLMINGIASTPFSALGLPPLSDDEKTGNEQLVIKQSRAKYATDVNIVEEKISQWYENSDDGIGAPSIKSSPLAVNEISISKSGPVATTLSGAPTSNPPTPRAYEKSPSSSTVTAKPAPTDFRNSTSTNLKTNPVNPIRVTTSVIPSTPIVSTKTGSPQQTQVNNQEPYKKPLTKKGFAVTCSSCGQATTTIFEPDGVRPVYCKDCLMRKKKEKQQELANRQAAKAAELQHLNEAGVMTPTTVVPQTTSTTTSITRSTTVSGPTMTPGLSLNDLSKAAPVDFKGHKIKVSHPNNQTGNHLESSTNSEIELSENQDVIINH